MEGAKDGTDFLGRARKDHCGGSMSILSQCVRFVDDEPICVGKKSFVSHDLGETVVE
jgi:hypothetical protein